VLRLAAASDGASSDVIDAALALPLDRGIDPETLWTSLALVLRERKDPAAYLTMIRGMTDPTAARLLEFVTVLRSSKNHAEAERLLDGLDMLSRGQAYSAALVLEGQQAPPEWRRAARELLFVSERPYFAAAAVANEDSV
jgi:hypothetical protein